MNAPARNRNETFAPLSRVGIPGVAELTGQARSSRSQGCQTEARRSGSSVEEMVVASYDESWFEPVLYSPAPAGEGGSKEEVAKLRKTLDHCHDQLKVSNSERQRISRQLHLANKKIEELQMGRACEKFRNIFKIAVSDADQKAKVKLFRHWGAITVETKVTEAAMRKANSTNYGQGVKSLEVTSLRTRTLTPTLTPPRRPQGVP